MDKEVNFNINTYMPVRLFTGEKILEKQGKALKRLGRKCLIVTGRRGAKACGALDDAVKALKAEQISFEIFDGIGPNPLLTDCMTAAGQAVSSGADFVMGIGGGSPMDAAKCIAVLAANPGMDQKTLYSYEWPNQPLPIALVGTTAGTGSEVTKVSVITNMEGFKKSFNADSIYAAISYGDHRYTKYLNDATTRSTAIDALAHCMESFFNQKADELSRSYAVAGSKILIPVLMHLSSEPCEALSDEERLTLYNGSIFGGLAINTTGTCFPHAMGYYLTEHFGIPHGFACAFFLRQFLAVNKDCVPYLYESFFREIGFSDETVISVIGKLLPEAPQITEEEIRQTHDRWINNGSINKCLASLSADACDAFLRVV